MTPSDLIIPADLAAGAAARKAVMGWMGDHPRIDDALLAVTELVNNAVVHGGLRDGQVVTLRLDPGDDHVRLSVLHAGPGFEVGPVPQPSMDPGASRGLAIVDRIADQWGVESDGEEVTAWFEMSPGLSDLVRG
jgi:anti-sigma regulatory factor (Ser/Thr protein kinase)